ncbi:hypothetical protein Droror1_Dr00020156 [Drosera rotundifolia]
MNPNEQLVTTCSSKQPQPTDNTNHFDLRSRTSSPFSEAKGSSSRNQSKHERTPQSFSNKPQTEAIPAQQEIRIPSFSDMSSPNACEHQTRSIKPQINTNSYPELQFHHHQTNSCFLTSSSYTNKTTHKPNGSNTFKSLNPKRKEHHERNSFCTRSCETSQNMNDDWSWMMRPYQGFQKP